VPSIGYVVGTTLYVKRKNGTTGSYKVPISATPNSYGTYKRLQVSYSFYSERYGFSEIKQYQTNPT